MHRLLHLVSDTFMYKIERHSIMLQGKDTLIHYAEAAKGSIIVLCICCMQEHDSQDSVYLSV